MLFNASCNLHQRPSSLTRRSLQCWRCPSGHFFPKASNKFHVEGCGVHGTIVIAWTLNHLIEEMLVFYGSNHIEYPLLFFFSNLHNWTGSGCHVRCYDNAYYLFFFQLQSTPQRTPNSRNSKPQCMLPPPCFTILLTTRLLRVPHTSSNTIVYFHMKIWLSSFAPASNPCALLSIHTLLVCDDPRKGFLFFTTYYSPWCFSALLPMLEDSGYDVWNLSKSPMTLHCRILLFCLQQLCHVMMTFLI